LVSDKPGHIIEIPESLGRDVDAFYAGKRPAPPMEAFMSDGALEQVAEQTAAAAAPVHAADLVPITKAEAARRTTFDGETLPNVPATRRVIPEPFRRPLVQLVSVEGPTHGRAWVTCLVDKITEGDMVVDVGRIACDAETVIRYETVAGVPDVAVGMKVILTGVSGNRVPFNPGTRVRAFRLAELWAAMAAGAASGSSTSAAGQGSPQTGTPPTST
jgi:hypothetical protein